MHPLVSNDGWAVTAVADAETGLLAALSQSRPSDLVLTDIMLPGRSGLHLVRELRLKPAKTARLPILVLTARGGPPAADGLAAGADDYISKPSSRELLARIRANHELHQLRESVNTAEHRADQIHRALDSNRVIGTATGTVNG